MPCTEFEALLSGYAELTVAERRRADTHLQGCPACRSWLEALTELDATLSSEFQDIHAPATLAIGLRRLIAHSLPERVSAIPEILDFAGWLGVICAAGGLAYFFVPAAYTLSASVLFALAGVLLCLTLSVTIWVLNSREI